MSKLKGKSGTVYITQPKGIIGFVGHEEDGMPMTSILTMGGFIVVHGTPEHIADELEVDLPPEKKPAQKTAAA